MSDYISREEAIMAVTRAKLPDTTLDGVPIANGKRSVTDCVRRIKDIPAADVRPVVRGNWTLNKDGSGTCSECGFVQNSCWDLDDWDNFCHHCGADMREGS